MDKDEFLNVYSEPPERIKREMLPRPSGKASPVGSIANARNINANGAYSPRRRRDV